MPPRKKPSAASPPASNEEVNTDATAMDLNNLAVPEVNDLSLAVMDSLANMRSDFYTMGLKMRQEHAKKLADIRKSFAKRVKEELHVEETRVQSLLERLDRAIQKKAACEEAMMQVVDSVKQETEAFQLAISSVYAERLQQCQEGVAMADQAQSGSSPLIRGEKEARARVDNLMQ
ncbi:uncharacterized protein PG998_002387 [Apiospora kogelbergensis]|uniref:uncharacterized protein n=1 Tax=Apiospora kogelbergensis TaxID=1337665 RepID=UPI003131162B